MTTYLTAQFQLCFKSGILKDTTMDEKLMYAFNDDEQNYPFYILKLLMNIFVVKKNR